MADADPKQAEIALAHLQAILDTAADGIITIDEQGLIQSYNAAAEAMFGFAADEVVGRNISMVMPPPYRDEHDAYVRRYLETGDAQIIGKGREVAGRRKDGTEFPVLLAVSEVRSADGRIFTGIVRDITELREAQRRVVQSERLAAIGEMVTGLAHESRNALQRIQACLEMLELEVQDSAEAKDLVARMQRAQDQLAKLYDDVRAYARPLRLEAQPCELDRLWRATWADLELERADKGIELIEETPGIDVTARADSYAIQQVFRNIFENAIAVCPDEGGWIRVRAKTEKDRVRVSFVDNGPGLGNETLKRIFDPFFTTKTKGSGLGMPIVKRIVDAHGGTVEARNSSDGAEVVLTLPRT